MCVYGYVCAYIYVCIYIFVYILFVYLYKSLLHKVTKKSYVRAKIDTFILSSEWKKTTYVIEGSKKHLNLMLEYSKIITEIVKDWLRKGP